MSTRPMDSEREKLERMAYDALEEAWDLEDATVPRDWLRKRAEDLVDELAAALLAEPEREPDCFATPEAVEFFREGGIVGDFVLGAAHSDEGGTTVGIYFHRPPSTSASKPSDPCPMCDNEDTVPMFGCPDCGEAWLRSEDFDAWAKVRAASASEGDEDGFTVDGVTHASGCVAIFRGARCSCGASEGDEASEALGGAPSLEAVGRYYRDIDAARHPTSTPDGTP